MTAPALPLEVRCNLIDALQIDLIGPTGPLAITTRFCRRHPHAGI
jgi:hypothetical protein